MRLVRAFTLIELLVVVIVLGLVAAIVLPHLASADGDAKSSVLKENLRQVRVQIALYSAQHEAAPGRIAGEGDSAISSVFVDQMTSATTANGFVGPMVSNPTYPYGPYLKRMPINSVNRKSTVQIIDDDDEVSTQADGSHGWLYNPSTLTFKADSDEVDNSDRPYWEY